MESIVFVAAHPDDVAFSMGGTATLLKDRYKLHVLCATKGQRGYPRKGPGPHPPSEEFGEVRAKEEAAACALLGAELTFLGETDGEIFAGREICEKVAGMLADIRPVALLTTGPFEKPDHAATYGIAKHALHLADLFWTTELYTAIRDVETYNAKYADLYVNITAVLDQKRQLAACHKTQLHPDKGVEGVLERNERLGRLAWCEYAEAWATSLALVGERWGRKAGAILLNLAP